MIRLQFSQWKQGNGYFTNKSVTGTMRMFSRLIFSGKVVMALSSSITLSGLGEA